jgi:hypothetical protein
MSRSSSYLAAIVATAALLPSLIAGAREELVMLLKDRARASRSDSSFCSTVA